jgi:hypothetical protein
MPESLHVCADACNYEFAARANECCARAECADAVILRRWPDKWLLRKINRDSRAFRSQMLYPIELWLLLLL